ncbi:DUF2254 domain-containing protein [Pararhizobium mangrovi]|nr:DUF2254 domain-containing protein [Pararhizobium mangrovi]
MNRRRGASAALRKVNASLWIWPLVAVAISYVVGIVLSAVPWGPTGFDSVLFRAGPSGARTVLTALVGGLVTALSVIFSLTITGLQTVHQQYSPRLLRNFMRDGATKITLGVFAGTVSYMLAVLRSLPGSDSAEEPPRLAIFFGMFLFLACVGIVAYFAQHITNSIRVQRAMNRVMGDTHYAIDLAQGMTAQHPRAVTREALPHPPAGALVVDIWRNGYVREVDVERLAAFARKTAASVRIRPMIGDYVVAGTPLAWVWSRNGADLDAETVRHALGKTIDIGPDRTEDTDVSYGLRQFVDVAVRAMSPSLNDPYTAIQAIDHMTEIVCRLARDGVPGGIVRDEDGALLVAPPGLDLAGYVQLAVEQPARYGGAEPSVVVRLLQLVRNAAALAPEEARPALREEVERIRRHATDQARNDTDLAPIQEEAEAALAWLDGKVTYPEASPVRL